MFLNRNIYHTVAMRKKGDLNHRTTQLIVKTLAESGRPLYVRQLIRLTGLRNETVVNVTRTLERKGVLKSFREKNRLYYTLNSEEALRIDLTIKFAFKQIYKEIKKFKKYSNKFRKYIENIGKCSEYIVKYIENIEKPIDRLYNSFKRAMEYFEANRDSAEELRADFMSEGIDLYEIPFDRFLLLLRYFIENREAYNRLRQRGVNPKEALEWATVYRGIIREAKWKTIPATEWAFSKSKRRWNLPHPDLILNIEYGYRTWNIHE